MTLVAEQDSHSLFAVVIPAYNEAATIRDIATRALSICNIVIVVDDGSADNTSAELDGLNVTLIKHAQNHGKAASLLDGINAAISMGADSVITLDGDGQHRPEDIPRLLATANQYPNTIIIGSRLANKAAIPAKRYYANKTANFWLSWAAGYLIEDSQSGFRIYPSVLFNKLEIGTRHSFVFESEILIHAAKQNIYSKPIPIDAIYATNARPSHFRGVHDITLITLMVAKELISHGMAPVRFYCAFIKPHFPNRRFDQTRLDGIAMLLLSMSILVLTAGLSLLPIIFYILLTAKGASSICPTEGLRVVLGLQLDKNEPTAEYINRLKRAQLCLEENPQTKVLILGGVTGNSDISEAAAGRNWLIENAIDKNRILIEEDSRNTLENLKQARSLLASDQHPVVLISHRYHLARVKIIANGFSIKNIICAADNIFHYSLPSLILVLKDALYLHWYFTGRTFARLTNNKKMLAKIQ